VCSLSVLAIGSRDIIVSLPHGKTHQAEFNSTSLAYSKSSTTRVGSTGEAGGDGGSGGSIRAGVGGGKGVPPGTIVMFPAFGIAEYCTTPAVTGYVVELPPCVTVEVFHSAGTSVVKVIG